MHTLRYVGQRVALALPLLFIAVPVAYAQTTPTASTPIQVQSGVQLTNATATLGKDGISAIFTLTNAATISRDIVFGLTFNKKPAVAGEPTSPAYSTPSGEATTLAPGEAQALSLSVPVPQFLSGNYDVYVVVADSVSGRMVTIGYAGTFSLTQGSTYSLSSCSLGKDTLDPANTSTVSGDAKSLGSIHCTVSRKGKEDPSRALTLVATINQGGVLGSEVLKSQSDFSFGSSLTADRTIAIDSMVPPGTYAITLGLLDKQTNALVALPVYGNLFVDGSFARIGTLDIKESADGKGVVVAIGVFATKLAGASVAVQLEDSAGNICGQATQPLASGIMQIMVPVTTGCAGHTLTATVLGKGGSTLATRTLEWGNGAAQAPAKIPMLIFIAVLFACLALGAVLYLKLKDRGGAGHPPLIALLVFVFTATMLVLPSRVFAGWDEQWVWASPGTCSGPIESFTPDITDDSIFSFNKTSYAPGETVTATAGASWYGIGTSVIDFLFSVPGAWGGNSFNHTESGSFSIVNTYT
ncbi:MAG: hypothetical protein KGI71_01450, partial [Patescibacteria group bacterium]|nr:hypothetical protein [Patescibacteria group bacterium]